MKNLSVLVVLLFAFAFFFISCQDVNQPEDLDSPDALLKAANKVKVCHFTGNGGYVVLEISANALKAHLAHGDYQMIDADGDGFYTVAGPCTGTVADCNDNNPNVNVTCPPTCTPAALLTGSVAAVSSSTVENLNLAGAAWTVSLNADCSVTFCLTPTLSVGSPYLQALTVNIVNEAGTFSQDLTYGSSDGTPSVDELVSTDGGLTYCYTAPAGSLPSGELGIFFMVNQRAPDNGNDLQRFIGITAMTIANDYSTMSFSWANRFKIILP